MKENTTPLSNSFTESFAKKITRKKFFIYAGAAAAGIYSLTKLPMDIFKSKAAELGKGKEITFKENPSSVKRTINTKSNG